MPTVDSLTRAASKMLAGADAGGVELDQVFPAEVDDGFRWGVARLPRPGKSTLDVLVGVPSNGRFTAPELVAAILEGRDDLTGLDPDEDIEIGSFRFELY